MESENSPVRFPPGFGLISDPHPLRYKAVMDFLKAGFMWSTRILFHTWPFWVEQGYLSTNLLQANFIRKLWEANWFPDQLRSVRAKHIKSEVYNIFL